MSILGDLDVRLNLITNSFNTGLTKASSSLNSFVNRTVSDFQRVNNATKTASTATSVFAGTFSKNWKDVTRMAQGIIFSQAFYKIASEIKEASSALTTFSRDCEDAQVSFSILMKDSAKAKDFVSYLQDFAADTPFTTQQAISNARSLLAYGFPAEEMDDLMSSISDAASASGDSQSFDRIARALGQIHTKGKLAQQEMLQLTEAGIPAFEILQEKLNLTRDQLGKIGKLGIPADKAIMAIVQGMNERYGGAGKALSNTTRGMLSTIKDDLLIIGSEIATPMNTLFRGFLKPIRDGLDNMRTIVRSSGIGGLMRSLIPESMLPQVQILVANLQGIAQSFLRLYMAAKPVISAMLEFGIYTLNAILPFIQIFTQALSILAQMLTSNVPAVRVFVAAIGGLWVASKAATLLLGLGAAIRSLFIVKMVAQGVVLLAKAISILAVTMISHPIIAILALMAGGLLAVAMNSKKVSGWFSNMGNSINKAFGNDPSKKFTPSMKKNNDTVNKFNAGLGTTSEKLDDMGDSAEKAGKKAKNALMSFDEVFNLQDPDEDDSSSALDDSLNNLGGLEIPDIDMSDTGLEMPDWSETVDDWMNGFVGNLKEKIQNTLIGAGIGALIGSILGGLIAGPEGAKWGAILGGLAGGLIGYFWDGFTDEQKWTAGGVGAGALIGGIIGTLVGGPIGAAVGAVLGSVLGGIIGNWWSDLTSEEKWSAGYGGTAGAIIGAIIGGLIGGPMGVAIGGVLGGGIGAIIGKWWASFTAEEQWSAGVGATAGSMIGMYLGAMIGGPLGAAIGAALGGVVGTIAGKWWADLTTESKWNAGIGGGAGAIIGGIIGTLICPGLGTVVGALLGGTIGTIVGGFWNDMSEAWSNSTGGGSLVGTLAGGLVGMLLGGPIGAVVGGILGSNYKLVADWVMQTGASIGDWCSSTWKDISTWGSNTWNDFSTWCSNVYEDFDTWSQETTMNFHDWGAQTMEDFNTWCSDTGSSIAEWCSTTWTSFTTWCAGVGDDIVTWSGDTVKEFVSWVGTTSKNFTTWWGDTKRDFNTWKENTLQTIQQWSQDGQTKFSTWKTNAGTTLSQWWSEVKTGFETWKSNTYGTINSWAGEAARKFSDWKRDAKTAVSGFWDETKSGFSTWYDNTTKKISDWCGKVVDKFKSAIKKVKDAFTDSKSSSGDDDDSSGGSSRSSRSFSLGESDTLLGGPSISLGSRFLGDMGLGEMAGHARGGIFNKEHVARFAEGNKAEAIIPLENASAMQPFVDAVASKLKESIDPGNNNSGPQIIEENHYEVGTLIADDRGLRKFVDKIEKIKKENGRGK